jgi:hypothetical protein
MKKSIFTLIFLSVTSSGFSQGVTQEGKYTSLYFHGSAGATPNYEWVFELEFGVKAEKIPVFFSVPAMVYNAKTQNNGSLHIYYGIRGNYLINTSKRTAVGPIVTYFRHVSGESRQKLYSNDWDAGARFYLFTRNPGMVSAAWTVTAKYLHTQETKHYEKESPYYAVNKFIISIGIHGLF